LAYGKDIADVTHRRYLPTGNDLVETVLLFQWLPHLNDKKKQFINSNLPYSKEKPK